MSQRAIKTLTHLLAAAAIGAAGPVLAATTVAAASAAPGQTLAQRGAYLAKVGDCIACHSAPGKPAFAGGLPIDSGHGIIYSTNITPDKEHGIGRYTDSSSPTPCARACAPMAPICIRPCRTPRSATRTSRRCTPTSRWGQAAINLTLGERRLYLDNCSACHFVTGKGATRVFPELDGATAVNADNPTALLHVMLAGARTPSTDKAPSVLVMPGFGKRLSDGEAAALATGVVPVRGTTPRCRVVARLNQPAAIPVACVTAPTTSTRLT